MEYLGFSRVFLITTVFLGVVSMDVKGARTLKTFGIGSPIGSFPGFGGSLPNPGLGGSLPIPGLGGSLPNPGLGGSLPNPGLGGSLPIPGLGGSLPNPGLGGSLPNPFPGFGSPSFCPFPGPWCAPVQPNPPAEVADAAGGSGSP